MWYTIHRQNLPEILPWFIKASWFNFRDFMCMILQLNSLLSCREWEKHKLVFFFFFSICWPCISIYLCLNINQLDALNFIISLFQASTYFERICSKHVEAWNKLIIKFSASSWLILRNKKKNSFKHAAWSKDSILCFWRRHIVCNDHRTGRCQGNVTSLPLTLYR